MARPTKTMLDREISWARKFSSRVARTKDQYALGKLARELWDKDLESYTLSMRLADEVVDRAVLLKADALRDGLGAIRVPERRSAKRNMHYLERIAEFDKQQLELGQSISAAEKSWRHVRSRKPNPAPRRGKSGGNSSKHVKLRNPKRTPAFEHLAWMGSDCESGRLVEWKLKDGTVIDLDGREKWIFLWSPKYKAIVSIRCPKDLRKMMKVDRSNGAAKIVERFMARDADMTWESYVPDVPLVKLGPAEHAVYRNDKWRKRGDNRDYIHELGKGVKLYCGPSRERPEIFICFGGKLTATERGLVF